MNINRLSFEKVFYHLDHLQDFIRRGDCYPVHMIVGLTNRCNHQCIWCYGADTISAHYNKNDFAPVRMIIDTIREASQLGLKSVTFVGTGEPTLHPQFNEIIKGIHSAGVEIGLFTNGSLINEYKAKIILNTHTFIRFSCSAADKQEHNRIHHAGCKIDDFAKIVKNISYLIANRRRRRFPTIGVQFLANQQNWKSVVKACLFWKNLGIDYFSIKPVYNNPDIMEHEENRAPFKEFKILMDKTKKLEDENFKVYAKYEQFKKVLYGKGKYRGYNKCYGQAFTTFLDPDGKLYICGNMHGKEKYSIGNVMDARSFLAVWNGERRRQVFEALDVSKCPIGCRMDPLNLIIENLKNPDPEIHPSFL